MDLYFVEDEEMRKKEGRNPQNRFLSNNVG